MINKKTILFVDGYNIINAWPELKKLLDYDLDGAREKLNGYMFEYAAFYGEEIWVIYDAYQQSSKKEKIDFFLISSATGEGIKELLAYLSSHIQRN